MNGSECINVKQRLRSWFLTINNYTQDDIDRAEVFIQNTALYGIYCEEVGEQGTPHLHIYFRMKDGKTFMKIKKLFPRANIKVALGNDNDNYIYCSKDGKYKEFGEKSNQGARTDLDKVKQEIIDGKKVDEIVMEDPFFYHQYGRTLHKIEDLRMRKVFRNHMTEGLWIYGKTGTGKSEYAFTDYTPETHYVWKYDNGWQDGYTQQDIVIIDEFRGQIPFSELLMLIDKHPNASVRRRGREPMPFVSKKVIITSSMRPEEVYYNLSANDKIEQLLRRIKIIELIKKK